MYVLYHVLLLSVGNVLTSRALMDNYPTPPIKFARRSRDRRCRSRDARVFAVEGPFLATGIKVQGWELGLGSSGLNSV
jgi:hypothetical protein